jgi:hypothetical protein
MEISKIWIQLYKLTCYCLKLDMHVRKLISNFNHIHTSNFVLSYLLHADELNAYIRVARWFTFKSKIPIWVNFGGPWIGKCWYIFAVWNILRTFGIFYDRLVHFVLISAGFGIMHQEKIWQPWHIFMPVCASLTNSFVSKLSVHSVPQLLSL